ncbi:hypothetical protein AX17_007187 [Amanita inopinata Kibby_2008]|nr:hypothetical protein AX17_007187 [Amanita inopinata Kibby_2008]
MSSGMHEKECRERRTTASLLSGSRSTTITESEFYDVARDMQDRTMVFNTHVDHGSPNGTDGLEQRLIRNGSQMAPFGVHQDGGRIDAQFGAPVPARWVNHQSGSDEGHFHMLNLILNLLLSIASQILYPLFVMVPHLSLITEEIQFLVCSSEGRVIRSTCLNQTEISTSSIVKKGVRIGDVGRATPDGAFDFLFNICLPRDHPINPHVLPEGFETLHLDRNDVSKQPLFDSRTQVLSDGINSDDGATLYEAENRNRFHDHASRHAASCYTYMNGRRARDVQNGSLYLITGCIKSKNWAVATVNQAKADCQLQFVTIDDGPDFQDDRGRCTVGPRHRWEKTGGATARVGPRSPEESLNQCVFLRGYKIKLQESYWDVLTKTTFDGHRSSDLASKYSAESSKRREVKPASSVPNSLIPRLACTEHGFQSYISDLINDLILLQEPAAKIALTHDDVWCRGIRATHQSAGKRLGVRMNAVDLIEDIVETYGYVVDENGNHSYDT